MEHRFSLLFGDIRFKLTVFGISNIPEDLERYLKYHMQFSKTNSPKSKRVIAKVCPEPITETGVLAKNPATHYEYWNGFGYEFRFGKIVYLKDKVHLFINPRFVNRSISNFVFKLFDREFKYPFEYLPQFIFELMLVPSILLFSRNSIAIHGSAVMDPESREVIVFSGTGGVGKTFLEMSLLLEGGYSFFADDIVILSTNRTIYPNYALPKLYRYNVKQLPNLKFLINSMDGGVLDKLHWEIHSRIPVLGKYTRRKIPLELLPTFIPVKNGRLSRLYILFRDFSAEKSYISSIECSKHDPTKIFFDVIFVEYSHLFENLLYHEYNKLLLGKAPMFTLSNIYSKYDKILTEYCDIIKVVHISPRDTLLDIKSLILKDLRS